MRVMMTSGDNVHSPEYHAEITAEKIISAAQGSVVSVAESSPMAAVSREVRRRIEAALLKHHQEVHDCEQADIEAGGDDHCECHPDSHGKVDEAMLDEIADAAKDTPLHQYFLLRQVRDGILAEIHHETRSQMSVHRNVHRSRAARARRPQIVK